MAGPLRRDVSCLSRAFPRYSVLGAALAFLSSCAAPVERGPAKPGSTLFLGKVVTMDDKGTVAEAVLVDDRGQILKVGKAFDLQQGLSTSVEVVQLAPGQVLMPGFFDPHMHFLPTLIQSVLGSHDLAPCLPPPYRVDPSVDCKSRSEVLRALSSMKVEDSSAIGSDVFVLGMNLDPSRQTFDNSTGCGKGGPSTFMAQPKFYLDACVTKDRPVLILDQSGHLAYVNQKAFEAVCPNGVVKGCKPPDSVGQGGGEWATDASGNFTGLLRESSGYAPFMKAMQQNLPLALMHSDPVKLAEQGGAEIDRAILALRDAGVTTIADGGLQSVAQVNAVKRFTELPGFPFRITGVVVAEAASGANLQPTAPACEPKAGNDCALPKWLGAGGIKIWVDGSTQGCTAKLDSPYHYLEGGHCSGEGEGRADYDNAQAIVDHLSPLWNQGTWRFNLHANGNGANTWALDALSQLQQGTENPHRVLLIHNTVGQPALSKRIGDLRKGAGTLDKKSVPALDVQVTHLIGHVAYWGHAFVGMLGQETANEIDPIAYDRENEIPFSFHSDSMVTPTRPLWFVEQAVTRRTWSYPDFTSEYVLGAKHAATVEEALRAITVVPARHHELDTLLGSIEPGKVADFVVLGANPLDFDPAKGGDPTKISQIPVIQTYINGRATSSRH
ncbi:amidohydrolase [Myxococcus sp. NMCA1]|uniref:amidohydrolase n=1 Tax=Myxococcus sp. NMCA1 TaxID=2996785 RepID=UPI002285AA91|nr:amidohydrolase family protein [Myxococcus sp. NMCA1]WAM22908.1 amidohydrolase family protein [Myxococcus sp. NMCA1]